MRLISIRENPEYKDVAIKYFQQRWPSVWPVIYEDCINHCIDARDNLPQWYLLEKENEIIGGAGLITNDFISRGDLYPWICAVFIDEKHRGNAYGSLLLDKAKIDAKKFGYKFLYLSTGHIGYYEKYGFEYIGQGYHPWEEESRIYQIELQ
jgi:N-acetylglutamate synthase-like GNAT family acetyltransferase